MRYDLLTILKTCGIVGLAFFFVGCAALIVAVRKAGREFRSKGYLKPPSGKGWFRFLLWRQYDHFDDPGTRFFFRIAHFCLLAMIIIATAIVVLLGSEILLGNMSALPGFDGPDASLPN